jgi:hypothetical protein
MPLMEAHLQTALKFSTWAMYFVTYPPMCVVSIAALIALAPMARRPFQKRLWKPHYWLVLTHLLFFAGAIALGVLRPNPDPHREGDPAALLLLWTLWWGSLASCVFWIWWMKGFRLWACALMAILQAPVMGALFVAGMSVTGDWL